MRIGYIVLPVARRELREALLVLLSTVPAIEQYVLARFMKDGSLRRHINRMRRIYRRRRDALIESISKLGGDVKSSARRRASTSSVSLSAFPRQVLKKPRPRRLARQVSEYRREGSPSDPLTNALVMNFAGIGEDDIRKAVSFSRKHCNTKAPLPKDRSAEFYNVAHYLWIH
ncbi:MAG: hypothetical protein ACLR5G_01035 [Eubacteriales bacterium]